MSNLPYDAEIEYIEFTGTQWIDTGVYGDLNTRVKIQCYTSTDNVIVFGSRESATSKNISVQTGGGGVQVDFGDYSVTRLNTAYGGWIEIDNSKSLRSVTTLPNGTPVTNTTAYSTAFTTPETLKIGKWTSNYPTGYTNFIGQIGVVQIWENDVLVRDYIPVRVGSTGYLYDKVSGEFFGNDGVGGFILGNDKALPNPFGFRRRLMVIESSKVKNPYITDGLVAMWDGIWNAGLGKHTQSDAGFKDLVSGNTIPVGFYGSWDDGNIDTAYTVESNGLKCNTRNKEIGIGIPFTFNLGYEYTIEYVRTITQFRSSNVANCVSSHPYDNANNRILEHHNYQNNGFKIKGKTSTLVNSGEWNVRNEDLGVEKVSIRMASNKLMTTMYNNTKYTRTIDIYLTNSYCTHLAFNTSGHVATLNCIRVYNKTLSDAEFLHNYNVDLNRFG